MKLRNDLLQGIGRFLALVPAQTRQRGRDYFAAGNVLELECVERTRQRQRVAGH